MILSRNVLSCLLVVTSLLLPLNFVHAFEEVKPRLLILPFTLNSAEDLAYLKEGVQTMLASRLSAKTGGAVVSRAEVEKIVEGKVNYDPAGVAKKLAADLVLVGSITAFGGSVSIDARLMDIGTEKVESFFATAKTQGGVIGAVDQLASDIAMIMSGNGRKVEDSLVNKTSPELFGESEESPDEALHPDRLFESAAPAIVPVPVSVPALPARGSDQEVVLSQGDNSTANTRSQYLDMEIQVMDVGDVFGDGSDQIVVAGKHKIVIFRQEGNRLIEVAVAPAAPSHVRIIALNLADLNGNGVAEIYISTISDNDPLSYAVEWNGHSFIKLYDKRHHYLRPILLPGKGWILSGQRAGFDMPSEPGLYVADSLTGTLTAEKLTIPESVNLFEFVVGDFTGDGQLETAVQNQSDDLMLYDNGGDVLWKGQGNFGYTSRFLGAAFSGGSSENKTLQVPTRLVAVDLNNDGRQELVAMANPAGVGTLVKTVGSFVGGSINVMSWNGVSFFDLWSTGAIGSYVASYQVEDREPRLFVVMVSNKNGVLFTRKRSVVAGFSLFDAVK